MYISLKVRCRGKQITPAHQESVVTVLEQPNNAQIEKKCFHYWVFGLKRLTIIPIAGEQGSVQRALGTGQFEDLPCGYGCFSHLTPYFL
jgi:hypothetical protein